MRLISKILIFLGMVVLAGGAFTVIPANAASNSCDGGGFLGFVPWYSGLDMNGDCNIVIPTGSTDGEKKIASMVWTIVANVLVDLFMVVGYLAIIMFMVGGYQYITSDGDPGKASKGRKTITTAAIGLLISILANVIIRTLMTILLG